MNIQSDSTQVTWSQVYRDTKEAVSAVADALKIGAEHVYEVLVKQQTVEAITYVAIVAMLAVIGAACIYKGIKLLNEPLFIEKFEYHNQKKVEIRLNDACWAFLIPGGILCVAAIIVAGVNLNDILTGFMNPEYGAIEEIKTFVK